MPNWCSNYVTVIGPRNDVERFLFQARSKHLEPGRDEGAFGERNPELPWVEEEGFLWAFVTPPAAIMDDYFSRADGTEPENNWYNWNIKHWGTKWEVNVPLDEMDVYEVGDGINYQTGVGFDSAWSPPVPVIESIAQQYPMLTVCHSFSEEGCSFWGEDRYENGALVSREEGECDHEWYMRTYGFCPWVEWGDEEEDKCPDCGATRSEEEGA